MPLAVAIPALHRRHRLHRRRASSARINPMCFCPNFHQSRFILRVLCWTELSSISVLVRATPFIFKLGQGMFSMLYLLKNKRIGRFVLSSYLVSPKMLMPAGSLFGFYLQSQHGGLRFLLSLINVECMWLGLECAVLSASYAQIGSHQSASSFTGSSTASVLV